MMFSLRIFFFFLFHHLYPLLLASLLKRLAFSPLNCFYYFVKSSWDYLCGFTPRFYILFHWSMCLLFWQHHTVLVTIIMFWNRAYWFLTTIHFFKIILYILDPLILYMHLRIILSIYKKCAVILIGFASNLYKI